MERENHGCKIVSRLRLMRIDIRCDLLRTSATMSALVANFMDASARRRSSGLLQPAIFVISLLIS